MKIQQVSFGAALVFVSFLSMAGTVPELIVDLSPGPDLSPPGAFVANYNISIDAESIRQPAQRIVLNLPGEESAEIELVYWAAREGYLTDLDSNGNPIVYPDPNAAPSDFSWRWYGRGGGWTVALTTERGVLAGRITSPQARYGIEPRPKSITNLGMVNEAYWQLHPEDGSTLGSTPTGTISHPTIDTVSSGSKLGPLKELPANAAAVPAAWDTTCAVPVVDSTLHNIDVLVLYTQKILFDYGSQPGIVAVNQAAIDDANQSLRNSQIMDVLFSLRGVEPVPNSDITFDYDTATISGALDRLSGVQTLPSSPYCAFPGNLEVASRRETMYADIVALARRDGTTCGVSRAQRKITNNGCAMEPGEGYKQFAYMVFDPQCNADRLNLAHELGHILGMEHDPKNSQAVTVPGFTASCPWSFAHRRAGAVSDRFRFRTVMSYWQGGYSGNVGPAGCIAPENCPLIDAYSNPSLEWDGADAPGLSPPFGIQPVGTLAGASPIGVPPPPTAHRPADGHDTLRRLAPIVEAFYSRPEVIFANGFQ